MRHVVFRLHKERYALPLEAVREVVVAPEKYSHIPHATEVMKGVMTRRGRVVPVVNLERLLDLPSAEPSVGKVVLLNVPRRELGLLVLEVEGIASLDRVVGPTTSASPQALVRGIARAGPLAITVLDVEALDAAVATSLASR